MQHGQFLVKAAILQVCLLFLLGAAEVSAKKLLENWNATPALDASFGSIGGNDQRVVIENGELNLEVRPYSATENGENYPMQARIRFPAGVYNSLTQFVADVRLENVCDAENRSEFSHCAAEFGGFFYNSGSSPTDATGDVLFMVRFGDKGAGLQAWWQIWEVLDPDYSQYNLISEDDITPPGGGWQLGTDYTMDITYDDAQGFTGSFGGQAITGATGPTKGDSPYWGGKSIRSRVTLLSSFSGDPDANKLLAVFDDVQVDTGGPSLIDYDDFEGADAALSNKDWDEDRLVREATVTNNRLKMAYKTGASDTLPSGGISFYSRLPEEYASSNYIQADMEIVGSVTPDGSRGELRFDGGWGNVKYSTYPGNSDGSIYGMIRLQKNSAPPYAYTAGCYVNYCDNASCSTYTELNWSGASSTMISPDTEYTLSLAQNDTAFQCKVIDKSTSNVLVNTSGDFANQGISQIYPLSENLYKQFRTRIRDNAGEIQGYFDNVYLDGSSLLLNIVPVISGANNQD